jgi:hypothetical protein
VKINSMTILPEQCSSAILYLHLGTGLVETKPSDQLDTSRFFERRYNEFSERNIHGSNEANIRSYLSQINNWTIQGKETEGISKFSGMLYVKAYRLVVVIACVKFLVASNIRRI